MRAAEIVTKTGLGSDPEVQVFEDAVALTFLETQFASTASEWTTTRWSTSCPRPWPR